MTATGTRPTRSPRRTLRAVGVLGVLLLAGVGYYVYDALRLRTTPEDGRRLDQLEADPLAAWQPSGGEQIQQNSSRAGRRFFAAASRDTVVLTVWALPEDIDLIETTATFLQAAEDAGWRFTAADLRCADDGIRGWGTKEFDSWRARVFVHAEAAGDAAAGDGGPELSVILSAPAADDSGRYDARPAASDIEESCLAER